MKTSNLIILLFGLVLSFSACNDAQKEVKSSASSGMKCGAGKCGANMFDGKGALAKKKKNILSQMRENDPRKECVLAAKNTKEVYNCVRNPDTKRMSLRCGTAKCGNTSNKSMKCGAGKCGSKIAGYSIDELIDKPHN